MKGKTADMTTLLDLRGSKGCLRNQPVALGVQGLFCDFELSPSIEVAAVKYILQMFDNREDRKWTC